MPLRYTECSSVLRNTEGVIPKNCSLDQVEAYDIGPGNMCINEAMRTLYDKDYDKDGKVAKSGKVNQEMLRRMLDNIFFKSVLSSRSRFNMCDASINSLSSALCDRSPVALFDFEVCEFSGDSIMF